MKTYRVEFTEEVLQAIYDNVTRPEVTTLRIIQRAENAWRNPANDVAGYTVYRLQERGLVNEDTRLTPFGEVFLKWMNDNGL